MIDRKSGRSEWDTGGVNGVMPWDVEQPCCVIGGRKFWERDASEATIELIKILRGVILQTSDMQRGGLGWHTR